MSALLSIEGLSKSYTVRSGLFGPMLTLDALTDVTLAVDAGETLAVVGESGCGKTTLGRCIVKAQAPSEGRVLYHPPGHAPVDISRLAKRQLKPWRREIRMIFQDPMSSLNPYMRVFDIVAEPLRTHGLVKGDDEATDKVKELMEPRFKREGDLTSYSPPCPAHSDANLFAQGNNDAQGGEDFEKSAALLEHHEGAVGHFECTRGIRRAQKGKRSPLDILKANLPSYYVVDVDVDANDGNVNVDVYVHVRVNVNVPSGTPPENGKPVIAAIGSWGEVSSLGDRNVVPLSVPAS